jgi:uncharacterized membrane protein
MRFRFPMKTTIAAIAITMAASVALAAPPGKPRFVPMGEAYLVPQDMNSDGSVIVGRGYFGIPTFRYTAAGGIEILGGGCGAGTASVSEDGNTILSCIQRPDGVEAAAAWTGSDWQDLGSVAGAVNCDASLSSGWDLSGDGATAVGLVWLAQQCRAHAGVWDLVNGGPATDLGSLYEGRATRANAVNFDGSIIAGWQDDEIGQRAGAMWVNGVQSPVLTEAGESVGEVQFVNADGSVMVGNNYPYGTPNSWIWTAKRGFDAITISNLYQPFAIDASEDGSVVVGIARPRNGDPKGFFWTKGKVTFLDDYLAKKSLAAGWKIGSVSAISGDGKTLAGYGINPNGEVEGFVLENF